jgi:hypothetical protein
VFRSTLNGPPYEIVVEKGECGTHLVDVEVAQDDTRVVIVSCAGAMRARHAAVLPAVQLAHHGLIAALAQQTPHAIIGYAADRFDVLERADHLKGVLAAVTTYTKAIVADTAYYSPVNVHDETGYNLQECALRSRRASNAHAV